METLPFLHYIFPIISYISLLLGLFGILIITIGSGKSAIEYIKEGNNAFQNIRLIFSQHLIIGLDFFVGKDIIDTMLLNTGEKFWEEIAILIIVVIIRVLLTIMAERELKELKNNKK
jgi:uncharacterized membrane protein